MTAVGGSVVWFTGAPSAGKSTLARKLAHELGKRDGAVVLLDGDEVRQALSPSPGYDDESRGNFYETLAQLAALIARQGQTVLVAATAHRRVYRDRARALAPRFVEVFVDTSEAVRRARDAKGLYDAEERGAVTGLPGADLVYETPATPDVVASGGRDEAALAELLRLLAATP